MTGVFSNNLETKILADTGKNGCFENLIYAIDNHNTREVLRLLQAGCNVNEQIPNNPYEYLSPITCAVSKCDSSMLAILLRHGADPNLQVGDYYTPFTKAIRSCPLAVVKLLYKYGGDVNPPATASVYSSRGISPLYIAIKAGRSDVALFLMKKGANFTQAPIENYGTLLNAALNYQLLNVAKYMLDHGADINTQFSEPYGDCITCPENITVAHSVTIPYSGDAYANRALDLLLRFKPDLTIVNIQGFTPLDFACFGKNIHLVDELIKHGAKLDVKEHPALHCAAMFSNFIMTEHLLSIGANPNQQDIAGNTPLLININCCGDGFQDLINFEDRIKTITLLINAGADPTIRNLAGDSFLDVLKQGQNFEVEKVLIRKGILKNN